MRGWIRLPNTFLFALLSLALLCRSPSVHAQSTNFNQLEKAYRSATGANKIKQALALAEAYAQTDDAKAAEDYADQAYELATTLNRKEDMARARLAAGRALLLKDRWKGFAESKAKRYFTEGLELSSNRSLQLTLLDELKQIAFANGRNLDLRDIMIQQAKLEGRMTTADERQTQQQSTKSPKKDRRSAEKEQQMERRRERFSRTRAANELKDTIDDLQMERQMLARNLAVREATISRMNNEQMRIELLLNQQQRVVDSLIFDGMLDSLALVNQEAELRQRETQISLQEAELNLQQSRRNLFIAIGASVLLVAIGLFLRNRGMARHTQTLERKNELIQEERHRAEKLLLNILPPTIAEELKANGIAQARQYEQVTVMFTDFVDFSRISAALPPQELLDALDYCFKAFDRIIEKHALEKIKTIGDAYMCAGGLPEIDTDHAVRTIRAALEIQAFLHNLEQQKEAENIPFFKARIGIHTGPTVAGVVGLKKFAYDIWGDTVNIAARLETAGEAGAINVSAATYELAKGEFEFIHRGKIPAKNIGEVDMYFVHSKTV